jgi:hypothetical protein
MFDSAGDSWNFGTSEGANIRIQFGLNPNYSQTFDGPVDSRGYGSNSRVEDIVVPAGWGDTVKTTITLTDGTYRDENRWELRGPYY